MKDKASEKHNSPDTPPKEGEKSYWNKWYLLVTLFLLTQVAIYYFITEYFR